MCRGVGGASARARHRRGVGDASAGARQGVGRREGRGIGGASAGAWCLPGVSKGGQWCRRRRRERQSGASFERESEIAAPCTGYLCTVRNISSVFTKLNAAGKENQQRPIRSARC
jgi:hypothetical protein